MQTYRELFRRDTADKPYIHLKKIENIIGASEAEYFIKLNKSEYF